MNETNNEESILYEALERKPEIAVPADFYLRMRASIAAERVIPARPKISFARVAAYVTAACLAVVLAVLTVLFPNAIKAPESMTFILELIIMAQLMAVGCWLGLRRES